MMATKRFFAFTVIFSLLTGVYSESFRVRKTHIADLSQTTLESSPVSCKIYDAFAVILPEDRTFLEGIEIKIVIPESIASWRNSVAATIYDKISPEPKPSQIDYSGTRFYVNALPGRLSWIIQVPLTKDNSIKENQYSAKIEPILNPKCTNIFLKFQPVMKGIPEEVLEAELQVSARPIFSDKGRLKLNLKTTEKDLQPLTVFIDDKISDLSKDIILTAGSHDLSIISENYRNEVRTFYIEQAKNTELEVELRGVEPSLLINAPSGTKVYLDGNLVKEIGSEFIISEGEHSVKFVIGDYEVIRALNAQKGKTYKANFEVDLYISDGED
ncbi:MAG: hypothetical protein HUK25_00925 [Treponema sp.]|nr:hypothetical protein [Treponema sp.]